MQPTPIPPIFVGPEKAADALGCSRATLYRWMADGTVPSVKVGRLRRIPVIALEQWAREVADGAPQDPAPTDIASEGR